MSKRNYDAVSKSGPVMASAVHAGAVETDNLQPESKSKRPRSNKTSDSQTRETSPQLDAKAISLLLENLDRLETVVQDLKKYRTSQNGAKMKPTATVPDLPERIAELSQVLSPVFRKLTNSAAEGTLASLTKLTSADIAQPFPPIPKILDPALETASLTHSAMVRVGEEHLSYERMEWMGDAYLEVIASCFISKTFPRISSGLCAQYREILVRNQTLSAYTQHYGLDTRAKLPMEFAKDGREGVGGHGASSKERTKVMGDLFESYIGALIISDPENGIRQAAEFLKPIWAKALEKHILNEEKRQGKQEARIAAGETGRERAPKEDLLVVLSVKGIKLEYKDIIRKKQKKDVDLGLEVFTVGCYLTGWGETNKELGVGTARSKKEAGQKAAQAALANKKLMKVYSEKKKAFIAAQAQQAALIASETPPAPATQD